MWEMFCTRGGDLVIEFRDVLGSAAGATAQWTAYYRFSATGKKVVNRISADFIIENGKIVSHTDHFSFYRWAGQALGIKGLLLGWTPLVKNKVQKMAMNNLSRFIKQSGK
jgi:hypothetical protein